MTFYTTTKLSENMHETPEGYLVCVGVPIARTGEMEYGAGEVPIEPGPNGLVVIERDEEEVFRPETMASFVAKPVTILHPEDFLNPKNWSVTAKGSVQNVRRGEGEQKNDLIADLFITDSEAINLVKNGLREVSCGYDAKYTQIERGRGKQSHIVGNHLALVDEGRAGSSYAINDHKRKGSPMSVKDRIKAIFAKAQDEAMKVADEAAEEKPKEEKKEPAKDDGQGCSMDDVMRAVKDLGAKVDGYVNKDASTAPTNSEPAKIVAKDDEPPAPTVAPSMEERMQKLEAAVAAISEKLASNTGDDGDDDMDEETGDDDGDDEVTDDDDDFPASTMTGDDASRIEILAPGMKAKGKDAKAKALSQAYSTADGKFIIDQFTGGKAPDLKNEKFVGTLFIAASEILKNNRQAELSRTKRTEDFRSNLGIPEGAMTPEKVNEMNSKHYGSKSSH